MSALLHDVIEKAGTWPRAAQEELAAIAGEMDAIVRGKPYIASADELAAIDAADHSGIAETAEVEAVLSSMRRE